VNLNYFISAAQADYIAAAVELIAADGYRLLPQYQFNAHTGLWRHATRPPSAPLSLADVGYGPDGDLTYPRLRGRVGEDVFAGYLSEASAILDGLPGKLDDGPTGLSPDFEALRWFPLPPGCLSSGSTTDPVNTPLRIM
jgi:hypothetical protein